MPPVLQFPNVVGSFYEGYDNAMKRYAQQQSLANNIEDRAFLNEQRRQDAEWRSLDRDRKRKKWESEDNQHTIFSQIDLTLPYIANKDKIKKLPADKQQAIIAFYAKTPADQRKRLAEIQNASREFIVNTFPKIRDEQTYQQVRAMAPQFLAQSGATNEEIQRIMQTSLPPKYDPRNIETLLAMAGYKPTQKVLSPGQSLVVDENIVATAPLKEDKKRITTDKALQEIAKAKSAIARLAASNGLDAMSLLTLGRDEVSKMVKNISSEARDAIMAYRDIAEYYQRFVDKERPTGDPQAVYNRLRDEGLSHEQVVKKMQEMGY